MGNTESKKTGTKMKVLLLISCLVMATMAAPNTRNDLTCQICMDIVTDFEWLTSDKTEQEIVDFVKEICHALGSTISGFEATCNALVQAQLPALIDDLVNK